MATKSDALAGNEDKNGDNMSLLEANQSQFDKILWVFHFYYRKWCLFSFADIDGLIGGAATPSNFSFHALLKFLKFKKYFNRHSKW